MINKVLQIQDHRYKSHFCFVEAVCVDSCKYPLLIPRLHYIIMNKMAKDKKYKPQQSQSKKDEDHPQYWEYPGLLPLLRQKRKATDGAPGL